MGENWEMSKFGDKLKGSILIGCCHLFTLQKQKLSKDKQRLYSKSCSLQGSTMKGWVLCTPGSQRYCEVGKSYFLSLHLDSFQAQWGQSNLKLRDLHSNFRPTMGKAILVMLFKLPCSQFQQIASNLILLLACLRDSEKIFSWIQTAVKLRDRCIFVL